VWNSLPFMAPSSFSSGRKRKRGRRSWGEGGSDAPGAREPTLQEGRSKRESAHGPGTHLIFPLI
jgi:hypothetical protein